MFLSHLIGAFRQWRRYNQSFRELNRLGDRELADIGITHSDISRVAWDTPSAKRQKRASPTAQRPPARRALSWLGPFHAL